MLFLIAFVGAAIIALVLWKAMSSGGPQVPQPPRRPTTGSGRPRVNGPDDDPDFLRQLDEKVRRREDPPGA
ncbi:hypothetical protein ACQPZA_33850 [Pseudonocardia xinjiangensis]|uniref:hypothetical protein n=1 Tax=Pseudonocardia xinjiangensis TaxID=75289 RepID=UPI003D8E492A